MVIKQEHGNAIKQESSDDGKQFSRSMHSLDAIKRESSQVRSRTQLCADDYVVKTLSLMAFNASTRKWHSSWNKTQQTVLHSLSNRQGIHQTFHSHQHANIFGISCKQLLMIQRNANSTSNNRAIQATRSDKSIIPRVEDDTTRHKSLIPFARLAIAEQCRLQRQLFQQQSIANLFGNQNRLSSNHHLNDAMYSSPQRHGRDSHYHRYSNGMDSLDVDGQSVIIGAEYLKSSLMGQPWYSNIQSMPKPFSSPRRLKQSVWQECILPKVVRMVLWQGMCINAFPKSAMHGKANDDRQQQQTSSNGLPMGKTDSSSPTGAYYASTGMTDESGSNVSENRMAIDGNRVSAYRSVCLLILASTTKQASSFVDGTSSVSNESSNTTVYSGIFKIERIESSNSNHGTANNHGIANNSGIASKNGATDKNGTSGYLNLNGTSGYSSSSGTGGYSNTNGTAGYTSQEDVVHCECLEEFRIGDARMVDVYVSSLKFQMILENPSLQLVSDFWLNASSPVGGSPLTWLPSVLPSLPSIMHSSQLGNSQSREFSVSGINGSIGNPNSNPNNPVSPSIAGTAKSNKGNKTSHNSSNANDKQQHVKTQPLNNASTVESVQLSMHQTSVLSPVNANGIPVSNLSHDQPIKQQQIDSFQQESMAMSSYPSSASPTQAYHYIQQQQQQPEQQPLSPPGTISPMLLHSTGNYPGGMAQHPVMYHPPQPHQYHPSLMTTHPHAYSMQQHPH